MRIHKEGYFSIFLTLVFLIAVNTILHYWMDAYFEIRGIVWAVSALFFLWILYFFRKPAIVVEKRRDAVLSPADGKVVAIEEVVEGEYFKDKRIQVSVFMSPLNVHLNRYPIGGTVKYFKHHNGHFHVAWHPKSSLENEHASTVVDNNRGTEILFKQIAGAVARRIVNYAKISENVEQGEECGFIKFGSRVDVLLPPESELRVHLGDIVYGGITELARIAGNA